MKLALVIISLTASLFILNGCAAKQTYRNHCKAEVDAAWKELDLMASNGFSGSVSYTKALGLITAAKTMQTVENYDSCVGKAKKARYYMAQARQGK